MEATNRSSPEWFGAASQFHKRNLDCQRYYSIIDRIDALVRRRLSGLLFIIVFLGLRLLLLRLLLLLLLLLLHVVGRTKLGHAARRTNERFRGRNLPRGVRRKNSPVWNFEPRLLPVGFGERWSVSQSAK